MKGWFQRWLGIAPTQNISDEEAETEPTDLDAATSGKDSNEPWIDIKGTVADDGRIALEADWNDAFISHLRDEGINGANDEAIVQQYITIMHRQLMNEGMGFE